jgi:uncharacterized phage protein (TIGR02220 family)
MQTIHIKNLEKYHPSYKDRNLIWCKAYFKMLNADPEFEMLCEIDKWRFLAFIMLELQLKTPVPLESGYLARKGFDLKKRPISLTLQMLHTLIEVCNENVTQNNIKKRREYKEEVYKEDKEIEEILSDLNLVLNSSYKLSSLKTKELIEARLKEGFTIADFKTVHRKMAKAWGLDNKMRQYLRPLTLYSNKFEGYLNRPEDIKPLTTQQQNNLKGLAQLNKEIKDDHRKLQ